VCVNLPGAVLWAWAPDGDARGERRVASAGVLPAARSASLRDGHADGCDGGWLNANADCATDLPFVPWFRGGTLYAKTCAGGGCRELAGSDGAGALGYSKLLRCADDADSYTRWARTSCFNPELKISLNAVVPDLRGDGLGPFPG
jgi:hypothetical protein